METYFVTEEQGVLDLTDVNFSVTESNPRVNDAMFTKFTFPFSVYMDDQFLNSFEDYEHGNAQNIPNKISGHFVFEGKSHQGAVFVQSIQGKKMTGQIDFGFEDLPNFDKKLSELPLEKFDVTDIYKTAEERIKLDYPYTNFNFPRVYNPKYVADSEIWKTFDGYLNDMEPLGEKMRRNYIENGEIYNVNIIHPLPHVLYVLKTGFEDAGYTLAGNILDDDVFKRKWIYSGTDYFSTKQQRRYGFNFMSSDFDSFDGHKHKYAYYDRSITIEREGLYLLSGQLEFWKAKKYHAYYWIELNGSKIWSKNNFEYKRKKSILEVVPFHLYFNAQEGDVLRLYIETQFHEDKWTHQISDLLLTSDQLEDLEELDEDSNVVYNLNQIDLTRAVPDITFGEFVKAIKNWFNYDLDPVNDVIYMNRLVDLNIHNPKDFRAFENEFPKRNLQDDRSFYLKFPKLDEYKKDNMFYDVQGESINGPENKATDVIEIDGYHLPVKSPNKFGYKTAYVCKDAQDLLQLVDFKSTQTGHNNAEYDPRCDFPQLFSRNWAGWLRQRVRGPQYEWPFFCNPKDLENIKILDYIYCENQVHLIESWTKNKLSRDTYQVDVITQAIV